eukprot:6466410-Amphidinium_carterae.1
MVGAGIAARPPLKAAPGLLWVGPVKYKGPPQAQNNKKDQNFFAKVLFFPGPVSWPITVRSEESAGTTWLAHTTIPKKTSSLPPGRRFGNQNPFLRNFTTQMPKQKFQPI